MDVDLAPVTRRLHESLGQVSQLRRKDCSLYALPANHRVGMSSKNRSFEPLPDPYSFAQVIERFR